MDWYSSLIYNIYLDDDYVSNDRINKQKNVGFGPVNYKLIDIIKVNLFNAYMITIYVDER